MRVVREYVQLELKILNTHYDHITFLIPKYETRAQVYKRSRLISTSK